jgi:microcin C transport system ATP-binding protein
MASKLIVMRAGQVVEAGLAGDVFRNPQSVYTQELMAAAFLHRATRPQISQEKRP